MAETKHLTVYESGPAVWRKRPERRRPGRPASVSPTLVALLRNPTGPVGAAGFPPIASDNLSAAKGLCTAVIIMIPFWAFMHFLR